LCRRAFGADRSSNFFELAVAAAIILFGFHSGAALATAVGSVLTMAERIENPLG
jgi:ACR3 family arsenite efflux pump ArsB